jgi:hypothetical protein
MELYLDQAIFLATCLSADEHCHEIHEKCQLDSRHFLSMTIESCKTSFHLGRSFPVAYNNDSLFIKHFWKNVNDGMTGSNLFLWNKNT